MCNDDTKHRSYWHVNNPLQVCMSAGSFSFTGLVVVAAGKLIKKKSLCLWEMFTLLCFTSHCTLSFAFGCYCSRRAVSFSSTEFLCCLTIYAKLDFA